MHRTIVALYDDRTDAEAAQRDLEQDGFDRSNIEIVSHADHLSTAGGTTGGTAVGHGGGLLSRLMGWNVPENDAHVYAEGVRRGGSVLRLRVDDDDVDRAIAVLERGNIVDVGERGQSYRSTGWTGYDETAQPYDERSVTEERARYSTRSVDTDATLGNAAGSFSDTNRSGDTTVNRDVNVGREEVIPVAEERVDIGKRQVERGGVRVRSYVVETPVHEQVNLRQEHVTVERRAADRALDSVPEDAFRERTVEVSETAEEAVVQKRAQVTEEVVIRKDVEERAQDVSDTVRRTEVEIEDNRTAGRDTPRRDDADR